MSGQGRTNWSQRLSTAKAGAYLIFARIIVRISSFERLRKMACGHGQWGTPKSLDRARFWAGRVERAAVRLPGVSKCLPKAIALQWLLDREAIGSQVAIAIHSTEREAAHAYHAWLECGGEMLIGQCNRDEYRIVLTLGGAAH